MTASDKFCLKWHDFHNNIVNTFSDMRKDINLSDVTLVCEENKTIEAHRIILTACSPFFSYLLKKNKHPHTMIYMRGMKYKDLMSLLDFIYQGAPNIYEDELNSFQELAERS